MILLGLTHRETMTAPHSVPEVAPDWPGFADMPPFWPPR